MIESVEELKGRIKELAVGPSGAVVAHMSDGRTVELRKWPSQLAARAALQRAGWNLTSSSSVLTFAPPLPVRQYRTPVACLPRGSSVTFVQSEILPAVRISVGQTFSPVLGECHCYSFSNSGDKLADPILPIVTGGLIRINAVGYFMTEQAAVTAAEKLLERLKDIYGDTLEQIVGMIIAERRMEDGR